MQNDTYQIAQIAHLTKYLCCEKSTEREINE